MDPTQDQGEPVEDVNEMAEGQQPEPTPSSEQSPEVDEEQEALANSKNPERTKAYIEKLKQQLAEKEKATPSDYGTSAFDSFRPQTTPQTVAPSYVDPNLTQNMSQGQVDNIVNQFVDEAGNVDIAGLNRALKQSQLESQRAINEARQTREELVRYEQTQQEREAHAAHPEIDPLNKEKFDPQLFNLVSDRVLRNMYEGKKETLAQIAADIKRVYRTERGDSKAIEREAVEKYKQTQQARNQGPLTQSVSPNVDTSDIKELRERTRRGDDRALSERLKALGI